MSSVLDHLLPQLTVEERRTSYVYDDATGKPFVKGMTLVGFLTAAIGVNLSDGLDPEEIVFLSTYRAQKKYDALLKFSWYAKLDDIRQTAVLDIAFNLGVEGLLHWPHFVAFLDQGHYLLAGGEIKNNALWISQVHPERAGRIEKMIETGLWPADIHV